MKGDEGKLKRRKSNCAKSGDIYLTLQIYLEKDNIFLFKYDICDIPVDKLIVLQNIKT